MDAQLIILMHLIGQKLDHLAALRRKRVVTQLKMSQLGGIHFLGGNMARGSLARLTKNLLTKLASQFFGNFVWYKA